MPEVRSQQATEIFVHLPFPNSQWLNLREVLAVDHGSCIHQNKSPRWWMQVPWFLAGTSHRGNRPRSIYQYSYIAPRLSGQTSIFGVVFFVSKSLLGIGRQKKLKKFAILTRKPRSHAWILIYRTWPIGQLAMSDFLVPLFQNELACVTGLWRGGKGGKTSALARMLRALDPPALPGFFHCAQKMSNVCL